MGTGRAPRPLLGTTLYHAHGDHDTLAFHSRYSL
jgi:hypothetical protein